MPKMRVHEVAKLLDKSSKEIITKLKEQGVEVQSHMSTVSCLLYTSDAADEL